MPPAANTGTGATSLTTCGHSTIEPTSPQCPPASPPWAMMMSTPASACLRACDGEPHSAATLRPSSWMCLIMSAGGVPRAFAINVTFGCRSATSTCAVVGEDLLGELDVLLGHERVELLLEHLGRQIGGVHALVFVGDDDVDAVRVVADVFVDPLELDLELFGREADGAEHAE